MVVEIRFPEAMFENSGSNFPDSFTFNTSEGPYEVIDHDWINETTLELRTGFVTEPETLYSVQYIKPVATADQLKTLTNIVYDSFIAPYSPE